MLRYTYTDQVLSTLVTEQIEARAIAEINDLGTLPAPWPERLTVLRVYILVCLEYASTSDDPFSVKLPYYKSEFDTAVLKARAAARAASSGGLFFVPLERA
ncbi:MAG: hypothetical protein ACUVR3_11325 [Candidatus Roseilinea sp.]|uniref:hypothetical protein n=1 Tax=Candidatus Roseilinea sp. TaxID=2838777 RepID=UPI00404B2B43